jgi:hypothetical protein
MNTHPKGKLSVTAETIRILSASELAKAEGGFTNVSDSCACNSFICSIASNCPTVACPKGGSR